MSDQVDVAVEDGPDSSAPTPTITPRRLLRWVTIIGAATLAFLVCWQDPSIAHDGVRLTLHNDGKGAVWVDATWQDGHRVQEPLAATLTARERAGSTIPPVALRRQDTGSARYPGTLGAGTWTVTVDVGAPGPGTCTAVLTVGTDSPAEQVTCDDTAAAATAGSPAASPATPMIMILVGTTLLGLAALAFFLRTRRRPVAAVRTIPTRRVDHGVGSPPRR